MYRWNRAFQRERERRSAAPTVSTTEQRKPLTHNQKKQSAPNKSQEHTAAENQRHRKGEVDGGEVVVVGVEVVSPQGKVDQRVLIVDVHAGLGLITCERSGFDQTAKLYSSVRGGAGGFLDSSHWQ